MSQKSLKKQSSIDFDKFLKKKPTNEQIESWDKFQTVETTIQNRNLAKILFYVSIVTFGLGVIALFTTIVMFLFFGVQAQVLAVCLTAFDGFLFWGFKSLMVHYFPANPKNALPTASIPQLPSE